MNAGSMFNKSVSSSLGMQYAFYCHVFAFIIRNMKDCSVKDCYDFEFSSLQWIVLTAQHYLLIFYCPEMSFRVNTF